MIKKVKKSLKVGLFLIVLLGLLTPASLPTVAATPRIGPELMQMASESPDEMIRVIIQKADASEAVESLVEKLGGLIIKDLPLINAFAAMLPANAAMELASKDSVQWVYLDAPVTSASIVTESQTLIDNFNVRSYTNNNGTQEFSTGWMEINDDNEADGGKVKIDKEQLKLEDENKGIQRSADLSMAETAILTLDYRRDKLDKPIKFVTLDVSLDEGATWSELYRFSDGKDSDLVPLSLDISAYISENTTFRFLTSPDDAGKLYVDNFTIEYSYSYEDHSDCGSSAYTVADTFDSGGYSANDGSINWTSSWVELDDRNDPNQDPTAGLVQIVNGELRLNNNNYDDPNPGVQRSLDLTGGISCAMLSFDFRTSYRVSVADTIAIEISEDGGANFIILDTIDYVSGSTSGSRSYNIAPFATANTVVRIRVGKFYGLDEHYFYLDNLSISYTFGPEVPRCNVQTVSDDFQAYPVSYESNLGTRNWLTPWIEVGENDGPLAGDIYLSNFEGSRRLHFWETYSDGSWDPIAGIMRSVDLSGSSESRLSFLYSRSTMMEDDYIAIEASTNGGASWAEVGRISGKGTSNISVSDYGWRYAEFDLTPFISTNTQIRFLHNFVHDDYYDTFWMDDVLITFDDPCSDMPPNTYLDTLNVPQVWDMGYDGSGITVAVVDSGIALDDDFSDLPGDEGSDRLMLQLGFNPSAYSATDIYGHGTHVAGIIGGNGTKSDGFYQGIAPGVNLIGIKISDDYGMAYESDTVEALQWIFDHKNQYNIRVVNLSINSTVEQSYHDSALNAAAEILWLNGIVVVAAAGNKTIDTDYDPIFAAPANDPLLITVGATEEKGDADRANDVIATFSSYDETMDGFIKPEIHAPGKDIVSVLAVSSWWRNNYPERFVDGGYFRISGTSMATPMVAGAVALLLQAEPNLTPDQVKYRLMESAGGVGKGNYLDVHALITTTTAESANTDVIPHMLLAKMALIAYWSTEECGDPCDWSSVNWDSVNWDSVNWDSVNWDSVNWDSVNWNSVNWNSVNWNSVNWNSVNWNSVNWNSVNWNSVNWNSVNWNSVNWNSVSWND
jgi:serine protease AprX